MPNVRRFVENYRNVANQVGFAALNASFPNDFNYYFVALELINSKGQTVEYLQWPVLPKFISETKTSQDNIKKTAGGVTAIGTSNFIPVNISLNGNFGYKPKVLVGNTLVNFSGLALSTSDGFFGALKRVGTAVKNSVFDASIKTGYGCFKLMESIVEKSRSLDENGNPYRLYFYNPILGNNYMVRYTSLTSSMDVRNNFLVDYSLSLTAVARLEDLQSFDEVSLITQLGSAAINQATRDVATKVANELKIKDRVDELISKLPTE